MIFKHWYEGGPLFMSVIYSIALIIFGLALYNAFKLKSQSKSAKFKRRNDTVLFLGSLTFLIGILGQLVGLYEAMEIIQTVQDISPQLIYGGIKVSMLTPLYGFVILILSSIIWFFFRYQILKD